MLKLNENHFRKTIYRTQCLSVGSNMGTFVLNPCGVQASLHLHIVGRSTTT